MLCSQNLRASQLGRSVKTFFQLVKHGCKSRRTERLSTGFDWISSSFAAMEISTQLKQVFKLIDANGDGKISPVELGKLLMCLGHDESKATKEAEGIVKEVDCNGDGFIDLDEFMDVVGSRSEGGWGSKEDLMDAFLVFDTDRNGFISAKELQRVLISLGYNKCSLKECFLMIRGVDMNGDGLVDFEEFTSMMTRSAGRRSMFDQ